MSSNLAYRLGASAASAAIVAALLLVWLILAVGVLAEAGAAVDRIYIFVLGLGALGAVLARFKPRGLAYAMLATAIAQALVIPSALASGLHRAPISSAAEIVGMNGIFVAAFAVSGALFFYAAVKASPVRSGAASKSA